MIVFTIWIVISIRDWEYAQDAHLPLGNRGFPCYNQPIEFLCLRRKYVQENKTDFDGDYVRNLQHSVSYIKHNREMEERYMLTELLLEDERWDGKAEGKAECILDLLVELGTVPAELHDRIMSEKDLDILANWFKQAAKAESLEQFMQRM